MSLAFSTVNRFCMVFVWVRGALNSSKLRFLARADEAKAARLDDAAAAGAPKLEVWA